MPQLLQSHKMPYMVKDALPDETSNQSISSPIELYYRDRKTDVMSVFNTL